jgi:hypothetical protein
MSFFLIKVGFSLRSNIEKTYVAFIALSLLATFQGPIYTDIISFTPLFILLKYILFIMIFPLCRYLSGRLNDGVISSAFYSQLLFATIAGGYVIFHMVMYPVSIGEMIWGYSAEYRLIGFTGKTFGASGLTMVGTTSVQMGVFLSFLFLLAFSLYFHIKKIGYLALSVALFGFLLLTYSRSGLVVAGVGALYFLVDKYKSKQAITIIFFTTILCVFVAVFTGFFDQMASFGSLGKLFSNDDFKDASSQQRIIYVLRGWDYIVDNPFSLFLGTGFGEMYTYALLDTPHLESLILTTLFQSGVFTLLCLVAHFYFLWSTARYGSVRAHSPFRRSIFYGYKLYIPGLLLANLVGGNSLQTDFIAPVFYFLLGACMYGDRTVYPPSKEK